MHVFKRRMIITVLVVFAIVIALISAILLINNRKTVLSKPLSKEDISRYINYDLTDIKIYDVMTERHQTKSETTAETYKSTFVCIKLNATDAQLSEIMSNITMEDLSIPPGDQRFFKENNINMHAIKQMGITWTEHVEKKLFSTIYDPYSMYWFFFESGYDDNYNVIILTSLPFWF